MVINSNHSALQSARLLANSTTNLSKSLARLSSGSKIVSPEDDAAGLAQAIKLNNQVIRDDAALQVLQNGVSFLQTKDGFLQKVQKALDRMSEISMLALDSTKTDTDRSNYNEEFQKLIAFINDVGGKTFNGKSLFHSEYTKVASANITWTDAKADAEERGGHLATITSPGELNALMSSVGNPDSLWLGFTDEDNDNPGVVEPNTQFKWVTGEPTLYTNWFGPSLGGTSPNDAGGTANYTKFYGHTGIWADDQNAGANIAGYVLETGPKLVINGDGDTVNLDTHGIPYLTDTVSTTTAARTALTNVKSAIQEIAHQRSKVGVLLSRVENESDALRIKTENLNAAVSRIRDVDVASESTHYARQSILIQSGTSMLAQANLLPQSVLRLLG